MVRSAGRTLSRAAGILLPAWLLLGACWGALPAQAAGPDGTWVPLGGLMSGPPGLDGVSVTFDTRRGRVLAVGGLHIVYFHTTIIQTSSETWEYDARGTSGWTTIAQSSNSPPMGRAYGAVAYDSLADVAWAFGGGQYKQYSTTLDSLDNRLWRLDLSAPSPAWRIVPVTGAVPAGRTGHSLTFDRVHRRLVLFGGRGEDGHVRSDVWTFDVDAGTSWNPVSPAGSPPPGREHFAAVFDKPRSRLLILGGVDETDAALTDAWALDVAAPSWSSLSPSGTFVGGICSGDYDARDDRVLVFTGAGSISAYELAFAPALAWRVLSPPGTPPPIVQPYYAAAMDPVAHRMVEVGSDYTSVYPGTLTYALPHALYLDAPPLVTVTATLETRYELGSTKLDWTVMATPMLYGPLTVERMDPGGPNVKLVALPDANGILHVTDNDLHPAEHHDYRLSWYDGSTTQYTPLFGIDTPPAPTQLHVTLDSVGPEGIGMSVWWSVPDDSATYLAPTAVEQNVGGVIGPWVHIGYVYPSNGKLHYAAFPILPQTQMAFRLAWGPEDEYKSTPVLATTPAVPVLVGSAANAAGVVIDWNYPGALPFEAVVYELDGSPQGIPLDTLQADGSGRLHFEDSGLVPTPALEFQLRWLVGGQVAFADPLTVTALDQRLDLLQVIAADTNSVALRWYYPDADSLRPMVLERQNGAVWDSIAALPNNYQPAQRSVEDDAVASGNAYTYRVQWAQDGVELHSYNLEVTIPGPTTTGLAMGHPTPNPARDAFYLTLTVPLSAAASLHLVNIAGRIVRTMAVPFTGTATMRVPTTGLAPGLYLAQVSCASGSRVERVLVLP